jgi:hypothetical protein
VQHFARAVLVDRTAYAIELEPYLAAIHLFQVRKTFSISWSEFLANERSSRRGLWFMSQPDIQTALIEAIEEQALPRLRAIKSLEDYLAFVSQHRLRHQLFDWPHCKVIADVALGDLDAARTVCREYGWRWSLDQIEHDEDSKATFRRVRELCARLAVDDRPGLAQLLHQWEAETVRNLKIEHLWEPTPFPLEQQSKG